MELVGDHADDLEVVVAPGVKADFSLCTVRVTAPGPHRLEINGSGTVRGQIIFSGTNGRFVFGGDPTPPMDKHALRFKAVLKGKNSLLDWGRGTSCVGAEFVVNGNDTRIEIGEDCMFSQGIMVRTTDNHSVFDIDTFEIQKSSDSIVIGEHVWLGINSTVLKGVTVGRGSIIGAGAIVTADVGEASVAVGVPARVIATGKSWSRVAKPTRDEMEGIARRLRS